MKKLFFFGVAILMQSSLIYSQNTSEYIKNENGNISLGNNLEVKIGRGLSDTFNYDDVNMGHYAIRWGMDKGNFRGPNLWLSGYGGMKFFTDGDRRSSISHDGNVSIGPGEAQAKLDVAGDVLLRTNLFLPSGEISWNQNNKFSFQNGSFGHYAIGWTSDDIAEGAGPALWMSGYGAIRLFTNGQSRFLIKRDGNVGIGTENPQNKLDVNGTIHAKEVKIDLAGWADYVFDKDYKLPNLDDVKAHIEEHKHLPGIPSEKQVLEEGVNMGEMQAKLLQKVEELTLYVIQQQEEINTLKTKLENR